MRVWKYAVPIELGRFEIRMPAGARVVAVGLDTATGEPVLWAEVDETQLFNLTPRRFEVYGTGHLIPTERKHLGTVIGHLGRFVWHLYEPLGAPA